MYKSWHLSLNHIWATHISLAILSLSFFSQLRIMIYFRLSQVLRFLHVFTCLHWLGIMSTITITSSWVTGIIVFTHNFRWCNRNVHWHWRRMRLYEFQCNRKNWRSRKRHNRCQSSYLFLCLLIWPIKLQSPQDEGIHLATSHYFIVDKIKVRSHWWPF